MLSAKLYEDRIVMIETEELEYLKTKFLFEILKPYQADRLTFLVGFDACINFTQAASNLKNVVVKNPQDFNID